MSTKTLNVRCFVKTLATSSDACKRTLMAYAHLRAHNLEETAPLPKLLRVEKGPGQETTFTFEHLGGDLSKKNHLAQDQYIALRDSSIAALVVMGFHPYTISHHKRIGAQFAGVTATTELF